MGITLDFSTIRVQLATPRHVEGIDRLCRENTDILGFILKVITTNAQQKGELLVALAVQPNGAEPVLGFIRFLFRKRDTQATIYDFCVHQTLRGQHICTLRFRLYRTDESEERTFTEHLDLCSRF